MRQNVLCCKWDILPMRNQYHALAWKWQIFACVKFHSMFQVVLQTQLLSVVVNQSKSDFSTCKLISRKRGNSFSEFNKNSLKYSNDKWGKLHCNLLICYLKFYSERNTGLCAITAPSYKQPLTKPTIIASYLGVVCISGFGWKNLNHWSVRD